MSRPVLGIGESLVASRPILERGGLCVFMGEKAMVAGPMAEAGMSKCAPSLQRSIGENVALVRSEPL